MLDLSVSKKKTYLVQIFSEALQAVNPYDAVIKHVECVTDILSQERKQSVCLFGFGKASCNMAKAILDHIPDLVSGGLIITKYGHAVKGLDPKVKVIEAGHPIPDRKGLFATKRMLKMLSEMKDTQLPLFLISGGGSALLTHPYEGVRFSDKRRTVEVLLRAGADIFETNSIRKHISKVKGGRLARMLYPNPGVALVLSDVIGDRLDVIASGPLYPDASTFSDAIQVIEKYQLEDKLPSKIVFFLRKGATGVIPETVKDSKYSERIYTWIIGSNRLALAAAKRKAEALGYQTEIISFTLTGEARDVGRFLSRLAMEKEASYPHGSKICLLSGGETTVTCTGQGVGGRNLEVALAFALEIQGHENITLLSAGTDGTDGPTDAAGAIVDGETIARAVAHGLDPSEYLRNNDTYTFFRTIGDLFVTGPTGTNVMDIQIILIG